MKTSKIFKCPKCNESMEWTNHKLDLTFFQFICKNCLLQWDYKSRELKDSEVRELASE